jgi:hypothetical protein
MRQAPYNPVKSNRSHACRQPGAALGEQITQFGSTWDLDHAVNWRRSVLQSRLRALGHSALHHFINLADVPLVQAIKIARLSGKLIDGPDTYSRSLGDAVGGL